MESPVHKEYNDESPISVNSRIRKLRAYNLFIVFQPQYKYNINVYANFPFTPLTI